ncbi:MGDG synthase family glycosyltransferase [Flindersiella endophytica]
MNDGAPSEKPFADEQHSRAASSDRHLSSVSKKGDPPSILILFSDTGAGHRAAARALETALLQLNPSARVVLADPLIGPDSRWLLRKVCSSYSALAKSSTWGVFYRGTNSRPVFPFVRTVMRTQGRDIAVRLFEAHDPDVVVSVHPLLNHVRLKSGRQPERERGHITVVTDLASVHHAWANPLTDLVFVGSPQAADEVRTHAVPPEHIRHLGLPIHPDFRPPAAGEQQTLRKRWGLDPHRPTILLMSGWHGNRNIRRQVEALAKEFHPWQVIVVCGRNDKLRHRLLAQPLGTFRTPLLVLGFVDDIADRMRASDLVITKAGPGTIAEALATGIPLILTGHVDGQENANLRFVGNYGVGVYVPHTSDLREAVEAMLGNPQQINEMKQRANTLARPDAALDIAHQCLDLANRFRR